MPDIQTYCANDVVWPADGEWQIGDADGWQAGNVWYRTSGIWHAFLGDLTVLPYVAVLPAELQRPWAPSYSLVSLCRYALFLFENDNLQDTWDFTASTTNLTIENGIVYIQHNPMLCARKIYELLEVTGLADQVDTIDVSPTTNGDGMAC